MPTVTITENTGGTTGMTEGNWYEADYTTGWNTDTLRDSYVSAGNQWMCTFVITPPSIGTVTLLTCKLRFWHWEADGGTRTHELYQLKRTTPVENMNWNEYDNSVPSTWTTPGAKDTTNDRGASVLASASWIGDDPSGYVEFSGAGLLAYVQTQVNAGNPIRLLMERATAYDADGTNDYWAASENADGTRPELVFVYSSGAAADHLAVSTQPANTVVGSTMANFVVEARDSGGTIDVTFTGNVTATFNPGSPGGGTLAGTLTRACVAGVATFTGNSCSTLNTGASIEFNASGLTLATSATFNIVAGSGGTGGSFIGSPFVS